MSRISLDQLVGCYSTSMTCYVSPLHTVYVHDGTYEWVCGYCHSVNKEKTYNCHHCGAPQKRKPSVGAQ